MHDKQKVKTLSVEAITAKITDTKQWRDIVVDFVQQLECHGILRMFMNGDKLG